MLDTAQIVRSAQMWVCDACGCQDNKSCGCNSTAHMEALASEREQARQRKIRQREREKSNEINAHVTRDADVENIEETHQTPWASHHQEPPDDGDDDQTIWRRGLLFRARSAASGATFENWAKFQIDQQVVQEARAAADSWTKLAIYLEELCHGKESAA